MMFDRYYNTDRSAPDTVHIHEHRAPTADSVRMLSELETAARGRVAAAIRLENCPIDGVLHIEPDYLNGQREFVMHLKIAGKRVEARRRFGLEAREETIAVGMMDEVARVIAAEVLAPAFTTLARQIGSLSI